MKTKELPSVDLVKLIGSILIFAMHCRALSDYGRAQYALELSARFAVPFFFVSSAYFLFRRGANGSISRSTLVAYLKRIGLLYLLWLVFNLPSVYVLRVRGKDLSQLSVWLVLLKDSLLSSTFVGSWYLLSSLFSAVFIYLLCKKMKTTSAAIISFFIYLLCVASSVYSGLLPKGASDALHDLRFPLNLFTGCFYYAIGKLLVENETALKQRLTKKLSLSLFVLFYILYIAEILIAKRFNILHTTDAGLFLPFLAASLFTFCLQCNFRLKYGRTYRKFSTVLFCCQSNFLAFKDQLQKVFCLQSSILLFAFGFCCVIVIFCLILSLQKSPRYRWAKYLT